MVQFIFSPTWFYGIDATFEAVTMAVAAIISLYSYNIYRFSQERRYMWFSVSFAMLSLSFLAKILTNVTVYWNVIEERTFGLADIAVKAAQGSDIFFILGFLSYRFLTLIAFLGMYLVLTSKVKTSRSAIILLTWLAFSTVFFSTEAFVMFHTTAALIMFFIFMFTLKNYYTNKNVKTGFVAVAFLLIMASQVIFLFSRANGMAYVAAEATQLIGYSSMLIAYIKIRGATKEVKS